MGGWKLGVAAALCSALCLSHAPSLILPLGCGVWDSAVFISSDVNKGFLMSLASPFAPHVP